MIIDRIKFIAEHGYEPEDTSIPHIVETSNLNGVVFHTMDCTSFIDAVLQVHVATKANPTTVNSIPVVFTIFNMRRIDGFDVRERVGRIVSTPESMCN